MDRTGQILDNKYKLVRLLGKGGMGAVYEAQHAVIGRRCAVKFLHAEIAHSPEVVRRFIREAQAAAAIGHPNIIDIYDFGVSADGAPFLVMEYLEGVSLADELHQRRKLPFAEAAEIVAQTLSALAVAHAHGVVHRDLKPDNLFLARTPGAPPRVKILDFGISRISDPSKPEDRMTSTGMVLGTPYYMAPEQARGDRDTDHRLDVYAMGVILYEALTGRMPFVGDNYNQLLLKILNDTFPAPRQLDPAIPAELEAVTLRALERDRDVRYPSARAMLDDLLVLLDDGARARLGISADVSSAPTVVRGARGSSALTLTPTGRTLDGDTAGRRGHRRTLAVLAAGLAVAAVGLLLWAPWKNRTAERAAPSAVAAPVDPAPTTPPARLAAASTTPTLPALAPAAPAPADRSAPAPTADAGPPSGPAAAAADAAVVAPSAPVEESVTVTLQNLPPDAEVFWDGARVDAVPFTVRKAAVAGHLEVRAAGFVPYEEPVTPERDVTVALDLHRGARPGGPHAARDAGSAAPPAAGAPDGGGLQQGGRGTSMATTFQ